MQFLRRDGIDQVFDHARMPGGLRVRLVAREHLICRGPVPEGDHDTGFGLRFERDRQLVRDTLLRRA